jgi:hypothetical protein
VAPTPHARVRAEWRLSQLLLTHRSLSRSFSLPVSFHAASRKRAAAAEAASSDAAARASAAAEEAEALRTALAAAESSSSRAAAEAAADAAARRGDGAKRAAAEQLALQAELSGASTPLFYRGVRFGVFGFVTRSVSPCALFCS